MTRYKVKVTRPLKLEILQFSKSISSGIFYASWEMTTDSETTEQYLNFVWTDFWYLSEFLCRVTTNRSPVCDYFLIITPVFLGRFFLYFCTNKTGMIE